MKRKFSDTDYIPPKIKSKNLSKSPYFNDSNYNLTPEPNLISISEPQSNLDSGMNSDIRLALFPLLKNGCRRYKETCAFDSFIQAMLNLTDYELITKIFERKVCDFTRLILGLRSNSRLDAIRYRILRDIFNDIFSCVCNINEISDYISKNIFPNVSTTFKCTLCNDTFDQNTENVVVNLDILKIVGLANLSNSIDDHRIKTCKKCKIEMVSSNNYSPFLHISVDLIDCSTNAIALNAIQSELILDTQEFKLKSVISYTPGHYVCYNNRINNQWECYDDTKDIATRKSSEEEVNPHLLIYADKAFT